MYSIKSIVFSTLLLNKLAFVLFLSISFCAITSYSQQNVRDSLYEQLSLSRSGQTFGEKDSSYINILNQYSNSLRFYKADSLLKVANKALKQSKAINYLKGETEALINIGNYYSDKGNHQQAIDKYLTALKLAKEMHATDLMLTSENHLANQYTFHGDYEKALQEYLIGIEIATKVANKKMLAILNENIALLYADQKDYEQSLEYFKIVKKLNDKIGDEISTAFTASNMADTYADMGNHEYAMFHVNNSISVFEKYELIDWLAFALEVKGKIYLKQNKFKWAVFWYDQSQSLHLKNVEDDRSEINLLNGFAEANIGLKKDSVSEKYALKALEISTRLNENKGIQKSAELLYRINKKRKNISQALSYHELFQRLSDTIAKNGSKKNLLMLKTKMHHEQQKKALIEANEKALAKQKNYVHASIGFLLILMIITLLVRRNEKIQKKLNKELKSKTTDLEKNEIELRAINETKDKMFSIIGHDLRGPIGAFQGLLQLLRNGEIKQSEFNQFIPKLRTDIDNISFTLNNLLSWGQTQMNGTITQPTVVSLDNLVKDNISLLSEIAEKKSIRMVSQLSENTVVWSDADQIDIVLRNLISNALKFTPKNGVVTIDAKEKNNYWEVSVHDTGVGIDEETQSKIFAKNANITTYGTDNEKGTGLGLSLCREMVENNKGSIWVESVLRKGTCFYFTIPKVKKVYEKAS